LGQRARGILVLALAGALSSLASSVYTYQVRFYGISAGFGYSSQSVYEVYSYAVSIAFVLSAGFLSDALGRKVFAFIAYFIGSLSQLALAVLPPWAGFPTSIVLYNTYFSLVVVARNILVMDLAGGEVGRWFGYIMMTSSIAMVIGPVIGYTLREALGYRLLFASLFGLMLASALLTLYIPQHRPGPRARDVISARDLASIARDLRGMWAIAVYGCLDRFSFYLWFPLAPAYLSEKGFGDGDVAILYTVQNLSWFLTSYAFGAFSERNPVAVLASSELLTASTALALAIDPRPGSASPYISFAMLGASIASWIPSYNMVVHMLAYGERIGRIYSSLYVASTAAGIPSPYIGSLLRETISSEAHLYAGASLSTFNTLFLIAALGRRVRVARV